MLEIGQYRVKLTNLEKVFWPELDLTKADLVKYYIDVGNYILPHLRDRPLSMNPYPDGIKGKSFYQKRCPEEAPAFVERTPIYSEHKGKQISWCLLNNLPSLVWAANRACIELHVWFSRWQSGGRPDFAVFDLDPAGDTGFAEVREVALMIKGLLDELGLQAYVKTSGKTGLHLYIPIKQEYTYVSVRNFLGHIGRVIADARPELATLEWNIEKRGSRIYIDYRQNVRGKTLAAPYSLRPVEGARVSAPITWAELERGAVPADFTIFNILSRLERVGDIFHDVLARRQILPEELLQPLAAAAKK
ncbi:MAG: non-homologous end-joining DNA ligase [Halanaerobium sp.]|nr:non-homologous end-joining DNA ligase [Halanaerobium sp.]